jgi:hypothetical protein
VFVWTFATILTWLNKSKLSLTLLLEPSCNYPFRILHNPHLYIWTWSKYT